MNINKIKVCGKEKDGKFCGQLDMEKDIVYICDKCRLLLQIKNSEKTIFLKKYQDLWKEELKWKKKNENKR